MKGVLVFFLALFFFFLELVCWEGHDIMIGFMFEFRINQDGIDFFFVIIFFFLSFFFFLPFVFYLSGLTELDEMVIRLSMGGEGGGDGSFFFH